MRHSLRFGWIGAGVLSFWLLSLALGAFSVATLSGPSPAVAEATDKAADRPAKEAAADPAPQTSESLLGWLYRALGLRYVVIFLFLTVNLIGLFVMNVLAISRNNMVPPALVHGIEASLNDKRYQEACSRAEGDPSLLGRILAAGVGKLSGGYDAAASAMQEVGEYETMKIEQRLGYVALIAKLSPLVGLLGTVDGMLMAFDAIARKDIPPRPAELAHGIGTALVATLIGLWIAIPAIAFFHIVRNRMNRMIAEVGILAEDLMKRMAATAKKS